MLNPSDFTAQKIEEITVSLTTDRFLNEISISSDYKNLFNKDAYSKVSEKLNKLIGIRYRYEIKNIDFTEIQTSHIKQCVKWAIGLWDKSIRTCDITGSVLAFSIIDYFFKSFEVC